MDPSDPKQTQSDLSDQSDQSDTHLLTRWLVGLLTCWPVNLLTRWLQKEKKVGRRLSVSRSTARRNFASTPPTSRQPPTRSKPPTCSLASSPSSTRDKTAQWKKQGGNDYSLLRNCEWSEKQKHKKQPWGNVECFAFGGVTVHFAPLETSFHTALSFNFGVV